MPPHPLVDLTLAAARGSRALASTLADELFLIDSSPSEAILSAEYQPIFDENGTHIASQGSVDITFRNGQTYSYPCSAADWLAYRTSPSKGEAFHRLFKS